MLLEFQERTITAEEWWTFAKKEDSVWVTHILSTEDAVHSRDGYDYDGYRLRVEFPRNSGPGSSRGGGGGGGSRGGRGRGPPARRSQYRVVVSG